MSHTHFTPESRNEIAVLLRAGFLQKEIASILGKTPSAVCQEIKRNKDTDGIYRARSAKQKTTLRRFRANQRFRKLENDLWLRKYVIGKLKSHWSPEQISGRLLVEHKKQLGKDCIYTYIYQQRKDLVKYLRCKKGSYRRRYGTRIREKAREQAKVKRINQRPKIVETRERIGDWEGDTIIGKDRKNRLVTNVERRSGYGLIDKLALVSMRTMHDKLTERFRKIPKNKKHTYTYDNGTELGKEDEWLESKLNMEVYRAHPYHSWERGCNENFNGLVREFFPKGTDFGILNDKEIARVERLLNNRPRKRLNYRTPREIFFQKEKF